MSFFFCLPLDVTSSALAVPTVPIACQTARAKTTPPATQTTANVAALMVGRGQTAPIHVRAASGD